MFKLQQFEKLRIGFWNIDGAYARIGGDRVCKLDSPEVKRELASYDVVGLVETHCSPKDTLSFPDFHVVCNIRTDTRHANRHFGGLAFLIRKSLKDAATILPAKSSELFWLKLNKEFFNLPQDLFIGVVYACPASSAFGARNDDVFELLTEDLAKYRATGYCIIGGDFNGRTGTESDFLNCDITDPLYSNDAVSKSHFPARRNIDKSAPDSHGKSLLETCKITGMRILNGRLLGDSCGKYTCYSYTGNPSTIDYICTDERIFDLFKLFVVHTPLPDFSIHCMIGCTLECSYTVTRQEDVSMHPLSKFRWSREHDHPYGEFLSSALLQGKLDELVNSNRSVNDITDGITNLLLEAAESVGVHRAKPRSQKRAKIRSHSARWFDGDCKEAKRKIRQVSRELGKNPSDVSKVFELRTLTKKYRKLLNHKKRSFTQSTIEQLQNCKSNNLSEYWDIVNQLRSNNTRVEPGSISNNEWIEYFRNHVKGGTKPEILEQEKEATLQISHSSNNIFNELCFSLSETEIDKAILSLKRGKTPGIDTLSSDMLKAGRIALVSHLTRLFNSILSSGMFPDAWRCNTLSPIFKKGDKSKPENYRGIAVSSALCKLFCSVLHTRLLNYAYSKGIIPKNQIGYQKGSQTADHILTLKTLIDKHTRSGTGNKRLYTCFVDFKSAFDAVSRPLLMSKLLNFGIGGCFLKTIDSMYQEVFYAFKSDGKFSDPFPSVTGVKQGCVLSPLLFNLYVSDLPGIFDDDQCNPPVLHDEIVGSLMFADDLVIMSKTESGMQNALSKLECYCRRWGLDTNVTKTKIMTFTPSGKIIKSRSSYTLFGNVIEPVKEYVYLGIKFDCSGSFRAACSHLYVKSLRALFSLRQMNTSYSVQVSLDLFNYLVLPIATYCSEIWLPYLAGTSKIGTSLLQACDKNPMETLLTKFAKTLLGVRKNTAHYAVRAELGLYPILIQCIPRLGRYWTRLTRLDPNSLAHKAVLQSVSSFSIYNTWATSVKNIFTLVGTQNLWENFGSVRTLPTVSKKLKTKCESAYKTESLRHLAQAEGKLRTYSTFKESFGIERYLLTLPYEERKLLSKLRLSSHSLEVEIGRHHKPKPIPLNQRFCKGCPSGSIGDEIHALLNCSKHNVARQSVLGKLSTFTNVNSLNDEAKFKFIMSYGNGDIEILKYVMPLITAIMR